MSQTKTNTATYTVVDIENVVRRLKADLIMIANSTGAWTTEQATDYFHDVEVLAKAGYLAWVDVTLLSYGVEQKAVRFDVDTNSGLLTSSRPGGVLWPKVASPRLRIVLGYTVTYTSAARETTKSKLRIGWVPNDEDTHHTSLSASGGRDYSSNTYGMKRKDWAT